MLRQEKFISMLYISINQVRRMDEEARKILHVIGEEEGITLSRLREKTGLGWHVIYTRIPELKSAGLIHEAEMGFPKKRRFFLTEAGRKRLEALQAGGEVEAAEPVEVDLAPLLRERAAETIGYMAPILLAREEGAVKKIEALLKFYATALTFGFFKPYSEKAEEVIASLRFKVALRPPIEEREEKEALARGIAALLEQLLRCRSIREKAAAGRNLTVAFTLDLSNVQLSEGELREALFWCFAFPGLRREGKV